MAFDTVLKDMFSLYSHPGVIVGIGVVLGIILLLIILFRFHPRSAIMIFFDFAFEKIYEFFEGILGTEEKGWIKTYITLLFFIILISNLLGVFLEFLMPIFGHYALEHVIKIPTADINFNLAMALIGVSIMLTEQFKHLGLWHFLYDYFPVGGKGFIPYEKGKLPAYIDYPLFLLVKCFDIIISLFLGLLEIVGHLAKLISLSFRLFGNVTSGGLLLVMVVGAVSALSVNLLSFEFPVIAPLIIYAQEILVSFIQALVFPLLIAIFIKVAKVG